MNRLILLSCLTMALLFTPETSEAQILSTKLKITVVDELGNFVKDAKVTLYSTQEDYNKETNPVQPYKLTDGKGRVTFKKLKAQSYYVIIRKGDKNNAGGGEVITDLEKGKLNKANVVISDGV